MKQGTVKFVGLALGVVGLVGLPARWARADDLDEYAAKLIDMDQRANSMLTEFRGTAPQSPDLADRRVLDAQVLYNLKNYEEAATILLDVVEKYPGTPAYDDALNLLGESLYQAHDTYTARAYLEKAVAKKSGSKAEMHALQRLIEIALRTGDYEHVEEYLQRIQAVPMANMDPSVPYVRAKYYYFTGKFDEAMNALNAIPQQSPYLLQSRYFMATIQVKRGDLAGAANTYDSILKLQAPDEAGKEIQDLARMAIARILYERSQFDKAIDAYGTVPRQS